MTKMKIVNPATGELIGELNETPPSQVDTFYQNARDAFSRWSGLAVKERLRYIENLQYVIVERMDELVDIIVKNTGKVPVDALVADIMPTLEGIRYVLKHAEKILSRQKVKTPLLLIGKKSYVEYMPRGGCSGHFTMELPVATSDGSSYQCFSRRKYGDYKAIRSDATSRMVYRKVISTFWFS